MTYIGLLIGAIWGVLLVAKRKGKALDMVHYAAVFAICGGLIGMIIGIIIARMA